MERAYLAASANGTLPANPPPDYVPRARPAILEATGKEIARQPLFHPALLVDYIDETGVTWDVVLG